MSEVMAPARPPTVSALETVSILLLAGQVLLGGVEFGLEMILDILWWGLLLWLVLKVTRRGSAKARIILTALIALGIALFLGALIYLGSSWQNVTAEISVTRLDGFVLAGGILVMALTIAQPILLWAAPTTRWIERHQAINRTA